MARRIVRWFLLLVLAASAAGLVLVAAQIAANPLVSPWTEAAADQIAATTERMLASAATGETLPAHVRNRLAEDPRNWLAIDALLDLAAERRIVLPPDLLEVVATSREDDFNWYAVTAACGACMLDPAACSLNEVMLCQVPIALTPVGDIAGIARAGLDYAQGEAVDQIDLALSIVGLGASVIVVTSGGSSAVVKAGASLARLAHHMGRLSPRLLDMARDAVTRGVDWARLPEVRSLDDLTAAIHADAFAPLADILSDLTRVSTATGLTTTLHLLPMVDNAADARHLANAAEALGGKVVGRAEVLGKARLFRATVRFSQTAIALLVALNLLFLSLAGLAIHLLQTALLRHARRRLRGPVDAPPAR